MTPTEPDPSLPEQPAPEQGAERSPAEIFAEHLERLDDDSRSIDVEAMCASNPAQADELRRLTAHWEQVSGVVHALGSSNKSLRERLTERYGADVDPGLSLDEPPSTARPDSSPSGTMRRLEARSPTEARYESRREIARGGMGAILEIWDADLRRALAMKVALTKGKSEESGSGTPVDERMLARFLEEAQVTAQLDHPGIVPVHELGLDADGRVFFTMPLVKGRDLAQILKLVKESEEDWTLTRALGALLKVCEAMAYAHSKKVIHRDLKPANVMVGRFGEVYVMDWGLAKVLGREDKRDLRIRDEDDASKSIVHTDRKDLAGGSPLMTMDGDIVGTPSYMSPEQAAGDLDAMGPASDVYSIGCILYHLCAGHMPYVRDGSKLNAYAVWGLLQDRPPEPLSKEAKHVPEELIAICEKAMARELSERYADTVEMADDLRAYLEGRVVRAHSTGSVVEFKKWVQRNQALAMTAAAALLATFGGLGLALWVQKNSSAELADSHGELKVLMQQFNVTRTKIAGMEAAAAEEARALRAEAQSERDAATKLRQDVQALEKNLSVKEVGLRDKEEALGVALADAQGLSYVANVTGAALNRDLGNFAELERRLAACPQELRGWEWDMLSLGEEPPLLASRSAAWGGVWRADGTVLHGGPGGSLQLLGQAGEVLNEWKAHELGLASLAKCTERELYASGGLDGSVRLWNFESDDVGRSWSTGPLEVSALTFSPDGSMLITAEGLRYESKFGLLTTGEVTRDCGVHVWDVSSGQEIATYRGHTGAIRDVLLHPDALRLFTASADKTVCVWDVATGERLEKLEPSVGPVNALALHPDGNRLYVGGDDIIRIYDLSTASPGGALRGHEASITDLTIAPDGMRLVSASKDRTVRVWDVESLELLATLDGHDGEIGTVAFSPDGELVLSSSYDDGLRVWDVNTSSPRSKIEPDDHRMDLLALAYGKDTWVLDLDPAEARNPVTVGDLVAADPSGRRVARRGRKNLLRKTYAVDVWDAETDELLGRLSGHKGALTALAWGPRGRWLASASSDRTARLWDTEAMEEGPSLGSMPEPINALAFSPDGSRVAGGTKDGRVAIFLSSGEFEREMDVRHEGAVNAVAWAPGGRLLASASTDHTVLVWDPMSGASTHRLEGHNGAVTAVAFHPDGLRLFSGSVDRTVRVWHVGSGTSLTTMTGFEYALSAVALQRDGRRLVTVEDAPQPLVRVWDTALVDAREMWREREHARRARALLEPILIEHQRVGPVLQAIADTPGVHDEVRTIATRLARRLEE